MGDLFGGGSMPNPPAAPPAPKKSDPAVGEEVSRNMRQAKLARGRGSTVLAGGVPGYGDIATGAGPTTTLGGDRR